MSAPPLPPPAAPPAEDPRLTPARKFVYASGDFTVNTALASMTLIYVTYFLIQVAGLRPELAGVVQLVGRTIDAFADPAMGRLSDLCRWRWGRRRPFFLIGALPFGLAFAALWIVPPGATQTELFVYYTAWYVLHSLSMTVLSVPYLALQPEMARGYDARTSLNTWRNLGAVLGILAAIAIRPVAALFGGGAEGLAAAGALYGLVLALPWLAVHAATWERPEFRTREASLPFSDGLRILARQRSFRRLMGIYLGGRIAMDIVGMMLIVYFTHLIGRTHDFELAMMLFIAAILVALPVWLRIAPRFEKTTLFAVGGIWWLVSFALLLVADASWPRWTIIAIAPLGGFGYALVDLMPWSMLGEVVDEDDLETGERREGVYNGFFMFLRKLAGAVAVWLAATLLGAAGYEQGREQDETARVAIRLLTAVAPAVFLVISIAYARAYPLTRARHAEILALLAARDGNA